MVTLLLSPLVASACIKEYSTDKNWLDTQMRALAVLLR